MSFPAEADGGAPYGNVRWSPDHRRYSSLGAGTRHHGRRNGRRRQPSAVLTTRLRQAGGGRHSREGPSAG